MKLVGSESVNGSKPADEDPEMDDGQEEAEEYDYSALFDAPNYADFIKLAPSSKANMYNRRAQSLMKAGMTFSLNNRQFPDAATFLKHGPGVSVAAGNLAAVDDKAAQIIDMLTAPDSPYVTFALVAFPMIAQLARNHQKQVEEVASTWRQRRRDRKHARATGQKTVRVSEPITVHIFRREITLPIRFRLRLNFKNIFKAFVAPTQHPSEIAEEVFSDPAVIRALNKMGLYPQGRPAGDESQE